jgi:hypothetical protein
MKCFQVVKDVLDEIDRDMPSLSNKYIRIRNEDRLPVKCWYGEEQAQQISPPFMVSGS